MGPLAVQVDELGAGLGQGGGGGQAAVDVGPRAAVGRHHPGQHQLGVAVDEPTLDAGRRRRRGARRWRRRWRPSSRLMASTSMVLPAPVSPVRAVMPGPSTRSISVMTPRSRMRSSVSISGRSARTWSSGSGGSGGRRSARTGPPRRSARQVTVSPSARPATRRPSTDRSAGRWPSTSTVDRLRRVEHERPVEQHVGRHRGEQDGADAGATRSGPRADSEYAVEPVGVATMRPSVA